MKIMHNPPLDIRVKVEKYLEKDGKWLVNFAYGTENVDERRFYVGIAYMPTNCDTERDIDVYSPNRYDVITYDIEENIFGCNFQHCDYATALHFMGEHIRMATSQNK